LPPALKSGNYQVSRDLIVVTIKSLET